MHKIIPDVRQSATNDCGDACIAAVCSAFDVHPGPGNYADHDGLTPESMRAVLEALGFATLFGVMTVDVLSCLTSSGKPVVCPVYFNPPGHWVVVSAVRDGNVYYHDPERGPEYMSTDDFESVWIGWTSSGIAYINYGVAAWRR